MSTARSLPQLPALASDPGPARLSGRRTTGMQTPWRMWPWALTGIVAGLLATALLQWPAHWIAPMLERATGERIQLSDVRGTLWDGSAVLSLTAGPGSRDARTLPGRTHWKLRPSMAPGVALEIGQDCCLREPISAQVAFTSGALQVRLGALDWEGPVSLLQGLGAPWNTLGFEGRLQLSTEGFALHRPGAPWQMVGRLAVQATSVSSRIAPIDSLGSYRLDIDGNDGVAGAVRGDPLRFTLATLQGPLRLEGKGLHMAGQLRFAADARADAGHEAALAHVLRLIGNRNGPITLRVLR